MKLKILFISSLLLCIYACQKIDLSEIEKTKILLSGTGGVMSTFRVWKLDSTILNNKPYELSKIQKNYNKTFFHDMSYSDSDLNKGYWEIVVSNKINQYIVVGNKMDTTHYDILKINEQELILKVTKGTENIVYSFSIIN